MVVAFVALAVVDFGRGVAASTRVRKSGPGAPRFPVWRVTKTDLKLGALTGVFLALGYQFQTSGLALTTPSKSAFITGLVVVMVPLLSAGGGVSRVLGGGGVWGVGGGGLGFGGLVLLPSTPGASLLSGFRLGELLTLLCAVAFAGHLLCIARAAPRVAARRLGTLQIGFAALAMLVTLPLQRLSGEGLKLHFTGTVWWALGITSLLATAAAFTIQSWAQQQLPPTHVALIFTLEPVFAWLFSLVFLGERLGPRAMVGAGLILAGIVVAELMSVQPTPVDGGVSYT